MAWLRDRPVRPDIYGRAPRWDDDNEAIEYLLLKREDAYIDCGLARYGRSSKVAEALYKRADPALKCTMRADHGRPGPAFELANPTEVGEEEFLEILALTKRPFLEDEMCETILERTGICRLLDDARYRQLIALSPAVKEVVRVTGASGVSLI